MMQFIFGGQVVGHHVEPTRLQEKLTNPEKNLSLYLQVQPLSHLHFQQMVMFHLRVAVAVMKLIIITILLLWMSGTSGLWMIDFQV